METTRIPYSTLALPALAVIAFAFTVLYAVVFDQGALASIVTDVARDSGGLLHEMFHDGRHLLGIPCH